ncbi:MAG: pyridoxamine 5'-phosphate oxidase family protein [Burkholderiales bacterium]|nr:pyridoxamine 5'-phosphate oxidase family protein [Burkholderiales bacterium]
MKTLPEPEAPDGPYHAGARHWQDRFDSRRLADRLAERLTRPALSEDDAAFIARQPLFFLATADAQGQPDVSYKGGAPGFVQVLDPGTLAFPSYDGNGMFRSLGNISVHAPVAMLFIDFERPGRLRVLGRASIDPDDPLLPRWHEAQLVVRVAVHTVFPNCPRYIHTVQRVETSPYVPCEGLVTPVPAWKGFDAFKDVLPRPDKG